VRPPYLISPCFILHRGMNTTTSHNRK